MQVWNWARIIGNTITTFALSAIAVNLAGAPQEIAIAFYTAGMTALLAFGKELQDEGKDECAPPSTLSQVLLF